jgi:hypothetical protein
MGELKAFTTKTPKTTKDSRSQLMPFFVVFPSSWFSISSKDLP